MPLKTKVITVPPQHAGKLREHIVRSPEVPWKEKMEALGRDPVTGRILPLVPKP